MRNDGLRLHQGSFMLDITNSFFSKRVVMHWHGLPREVVGPPTQEGTRNGKDVALGDEVSRHGGTGWGWTSRSWRSFPT